jgi:hypothetical protein
MTNKLKYLLVNTLLIAIIFTTFIIVEVPLDFLIHLYMLLMLFNFVNWYFAFNLFEFTLKHNDIIVLANILIINDIWNLFLLMVVFKEQWVIVAYFNEIVNQDPLTCSKTEHRPLWIKSNGMESRV